MLNSTLEEYKPISMLDNLYEVSNMGNVYSIRTHKILKPFTTKSGYHIVITSIDGVVKKFSVHRLVALAFLPNSSKKPCVNHIDGAKTNNIVTNLEWVTHAENTAHAITTGLSHIHTNNIGVKKCTALSQYHNVTYNKSKGLWDAGIKYNGVRVHSKFFPTEEEAALHVN